MSIPKKRRPKKRLRLYVWEGVLADYTSGIAFALATSPDEARKKIRESYAVKNSSLLEAGLQDEPDVYTRAVGFALSGGG